MSRLMVTLLMMTVVIMVLGLVRRTRVVIVAKSHQIAEAAHDGAIHCYGRPSVGADLRILRVKVTAKRQIAEAVHGGAIYYYGRPSVGADLLIPRVKATVKRTRRTART
jgi:hypothetical protein